MPRLSSPHSHSLPSCFADLINLKNTLSRSSSILFPSLFSLLPISLLNSLIQQLFSTSPFLPLATLLHLDLLSLPSPPFVLASVAPRPTWRLRVEGQVRRPREMHEANPGLAELVTSKLYGAEAASSSAYSCAFSSPSYFFCLLSATFFILLFFLLSSFSFQYTYFHHSFYRSILLTYVCSDTDIDTKTSNIKAPRKTKASRQSRIGTATRTAAGENNKWLKRNKNIRSITLQGEDSREGTGRDAAHTPRKPDSQQ